MLKIVFSFLIILSSGAANARGVSRSFFGDDLLQLGLGLHVQLNGAPETIAENIVTPALQSNLSTLLGSPTSWRLSLLPQSDNKEPLTNTRRIRYIQLVNGVEVHGCIVSLEIDGQTHELFSVALVLDNPGDLSAKPKLSFREALSPDVIASSQRRLGQKLVSTSETESQLVFFADGSGLWHLVYRIHGEIPLATDRAGRMITAPVQLIVDANDGSLIEATPLFDSPQSFLTL